MPAGNPAPLLSAQDADEAHLVFPESKHRELKAILFPGESDHPFAGKSERGAFCIVSRSTGKTRVSYLVRAVVPPESQDDLTVRRGSQQRSWEDWFSGARSSPGELGFRFSKEYHHRAIEKAKALSGGLLRVHTHPNGVSPSPIDRRSANRVFNDDADRLRPGAPLVAAITNERGDWSARIYEFGAASDPKVRRTTAIRIVGHRFQKQANSDTDHSVDGVDRTAQDSTIQLWGTRGQKILAGLHVGLVGCGGVGSILAAHLPRLGVGRLTLVDFDRLEPANANRASGASRIDIRQRRLKTHVAQREAHRAATHPEFDSRVVDGSVVETEQEWTAIPELLDCDVIVAAVDAARPRKVLDHIAFSHCIPVLNGGSRLHAQNDGTLREEAKIETSVTGPGFPCFECQRVWSRDQVEFERDNPRYRGERGYVEGGVDPDEGPRSPAVIGVNDTVAGLLQLRLQALVLGVSTRVVGTHRLKPNDLSVRWHSTVDSCDGCRRAPLAAGDRHELPAGTDWSMRYSRTDIPMPKTETIDASRATEVLSDLEPGTLSDPAE